MIAFEHYIAPALRRRFQSQRSHCNCKGSAVTDRGGGFDRDALASASARRPSITGTCSTRRIRPPEPSPRPSVQDVDRRVEEVPYAALGLDVFGLRWIRLDLATQPEDLHVDRAIVDFRIVQARKIEELFARK